MEEKVRLQHYVPKMYLKNFSNRKKKEKYIYVFDKQLDIIYSKNIKDVAVDEEFYDKVSEEQTTEKTLRDIEARSDEVIQKIISEEDIINLTEEEKDILSEFISYLMIRTKEMREEVKDTIKQFSEKFKGQMAPELEKQVVDSLKEDSLRKGHRNIMKEVEVYHKRIMKMKWILAINKTTFPIWTSDNPVAKYNKLDLSPYGNLGLDCRGFEMHIPLSPKIVLIVCDPISFSHEPTKKIMRKYGEAVMERDLQTRDSTRFVFSIENDFRFAQAMIKNNPEIGNPERKRATIK